MYDVIIIGSGVAGVFSAFQLSQAGQKVLLIDKGPDLPERLLQLADNPQIQYLGFGGLGLSEGKYNYSSDFGGAIAAKIGVDETAKLMKEVDRILCRFGGQDATFYSTENAQLQSLCRSAGLTMLSTTVRHLGTKVSQKILIALRQYLADKVDFLFNWRPQNIVKRADGFELQIAKHEKVGGRNIIIATGNNLSEWLQQQIANFNVKEESVRLDLGLRIEMPYQQWRELLSQSFETKLRLTFQNRVATTYCMNPGGRIIRKYEKGLVMPDGQNCNEFGTPSENINFTLFVSDYFADSRQALSYARQIIETINQSSERILVQRLGDLKQSIPTLGANLLNNAVRPSLQACAGNLKDVVPQHYLAITLEFFERLSLLLKQPVSDDTLLYGLDAKFFAAGKSLSENFETTTKGLFLAGDCSGITGSLSQAAANGLFVANYLNQNRRS